MTEPKSATELWICPSCQRRVPTAYCPDCGEEPLPPQSLTLKGVAEKTLHAFTSIDAKVARTAWRLLRYPGRLTVSWTSGVRRPYVAPFQLFVVANLLFFALQMFTGANIFSSPLDSHLNHQDWSEFARAQVAQRLARAHTTAAIYAPVFDRAVLLYAKTLIVLMTLPFALLLPLVFWSERRPFMTHVVFSLHHYSYLLLVFCVMLLLAKASALLGLGGLDRPGVDNTLTVCWLVASAGYLYVATGVVYGGGLWVRASKTVLLALMVGLIVIGYRFVLFMITLYATT